MEKKSYKHIKLENGMNIYLEKTPSERIISRLRLNVGASYEKPGEEGLVHFLEHCYASSSSRSYSSEELQKMTKKMYYSNAFTNVGRTWLEGKMLATNFEDWLKFSSQAMFNSNIDTESVERERQRVLTEINEYMSSSRFDTHLEVGRALYSNHMKGVNILGNPEVVKSATREKLLQMYHDFFSPTGTDLFLIGAIPKDVEEKVSEYFGGIPGGKDTRKVIPTLEKLTERKVIRYSAPELLNKSNPSDSAGDFTMCWIIPKQEEKRTYSLNFLMGSLASSVYTLLSKEEGIAYDARVGNDWDYNVGTFSVYARARPKDLQRAITHAFTEMDRLKVEKLPIEEIEEYKRKTLYAQAENKETPEGIITTILQEVDEKRTMNQVTEGINSVTPETIIEAANYALPSPQDNFVLVLSDPKKGVKK